MKKIIGETKDGSLVVSVHDAIAFGMIEQNGEIVKIGKNCFMPTFYRHIKTNLTHSNEQVVGFIDISKYSVFGYLINEVRKTISGQSYEYIDSVNCSITKQQDIIRHYGPRVEHNVVMTLNTRWHFVKILDEDGILLFTNKGKPYIYNESGSEIITSLLYGISKTQIDEISFLDIGKIDGAAYYDEVKKISCKKAKKSCVAKELGLTQATMSRTPELRRQIYNDAYKWRMVKKLISDKCWS